MDNEKYYKYSEKGIKSRNLELWENISCIDLEIPFKWKFFLYENGLKDTPKCYCGKEVKFIDMRKGFANFCSKKCMYNSTDIKERRKKTNIEKWGVDNPSKLESIKEKVKKTNIEKFGVEYPLQNKEVKEKLKEHFIEKWGVDNPSKLESIKEKVKKTNIKNCGVEYPMQSEYIKDQFKENFIEKWGVDNPMKVDEFKEKAKETIKNKWISLKNPEISDKKIRTNREKWGVDNPMQSEYIKDKFKEKVKKNWGVDNPMESFEVREKFKENFIEKWGVDNPFQLEFIKDKIKEKHHSKDENWRKKNYKISNNENYIKYLGNGISLFKCDNGENHLFEIDIDNYITRNSNILCTKCYPIDENSSILEKNLLDFIKSIYSGEIISNYRDVLEIDIFLPELNIGFEFNGLYWHSEKFKEKDYHLNKTNFFKERGIRIIHIWEDDWRLKMDIIQSQIKNIFNSSERIFARKCEVLEIDNKKSFEFLEENHIQGKVNSVICLGLFIGSEMVSLMCFDKNEGRKKMPQNEWNLNRFCNKKNITVVGGASKLFRFFLNKYKPIRVISYADLDWSVGKLYSNIGFNLINQSKPDYKYIVRGKRINKSRFRKSKLDTDLSESQFMKINDVLRIWDSGKLKFEFLKNNINP